MSTVRRKRWIVFFTAIAGLLVLQLVWWTSVFLRNVETHERLLMENTRLKKHGAPLSEHEEKAIQADSFHQRIMFVSESACFLVLTGVGLLLLYRALRVEEKVLGDQKKFVEMVSHESKTPITALKLRLESISEKYADKTDMKADIGLALQEVRRLGSMVDKVLNWQRVERGRYNLESVVLSDVVHEVMRRLDPFLKQYSVRVKLYVDSNVLVKGDLFALQNMVQSLVENAVLYNHNEAKLLEITLKKGDDFCVLSVLDNGPGISREEQQLIFERFYRGKTGAAVPGTGLGLYLVKSIVEAHRGTIELLQGLKKGTCFLIRFPEEGTV